MLTLGIDRVREARCRNRGQLGLESSYIKYIYIYAITRKPEKELDYIYRRNSSNLLPFPLFIFPPRISWIIIIASSWLLLVPTPLGITTILSATARRHIHCYSSCGDIKNASIVGGGFRRRHCSCSSWLRGGIALEDGRICVPWPSYHRGGRGRLAR